MSEYEPHSYEIEADDVEAHRNHDVLILSFASMSEEEEPNYLVLQRDLGSGPAPSPSQPVYVELNDQSTSSYGGIDAVVVSPNRLRVRLDTETAEALRLEPEYGNQIDVSFALSAEEFDAIRDALRVIFSDHIDYTESTT